MRNRRQKQKIKWGNNKKNKSIEDKKKLDKMRTERTENGGHNENTEDGKQKQKTETKEIIRKQKSEL